MRFVSAIKNRLACAFVLSLFGFVPTVSYAEIDVNALGTHSPMAEQGGICASFSALMENQSLLNEDLGFLWQERRKFSGAVIRRAVELSGAPSPSGEDIDKLIGEYQEWVILNLTSQDEDKKSLSDYQSNLRMMIATNCATLYKQADKAIIKRYPDLAYLINGLENGVDNTAKKQAETLLRKNIELNQKITELSAQLDEAKTALANSEAAFNVKQSIANAKPATSNQAAPLAPKSKPQTKPQAKPAPRPAAPSKAKAGAKDIKTPQAKPAKDTTQIADSEKARFYGQLGSYSSRAIALIAIDDLRARFPNLFDDIKLKVNDHKFASGKVFYRVTTGEASMSNISQICDKLWDARLGCLIKTKTP